MIRLQKILSAAGLASRRAAEDFIRQGRITVNGTVVRELGTRADPDRDDIRADGRRVRIVRRVSRGASWFVEGTAIQHSLVTKTQQRRHASLTLTLTPGR